MNNLTSTITIHREQAEFVPTKEKSRSSRSLSTLWPWSRRSEKPAQNTPQEPCVLQLEDVSIAYQGEARQWRTVVKGVSLQIRAGEVLALVGESGSGKTSTAQSIVGLLSNNGRIESGRIELCGQDITNWPQKRLDSVRGQIVSLVPQDPVSSLNPVRTIGDQVGEILRLHRRLPRKQREQLVEHLLERVGIDQPALRMKQYPHELSGGMRQRVLIATAIALKPALIIADEPTSALDVTVQRRILDLIDELRRQSNTAVLLVTHDLGVAADQADYLVVLKDGQIQEAGATADVLRHPKSAYTKQLLADAPSLGIAPVRAPVDTLDAQPIVQVKGLNHQFLLRAQREPLKVLQDESFNLLRGQTHALVGESGSGKTTTVRSVMGLLRPNAGKVLLDGQDIHALRGEALRQMRRRIQLVYQNPFRSLDVRQTVFKIIEEPLLNYEAIPEKERRERVEQIHARVGLEPELLLRRPTALSGGQRQRVAIARVLILEPQVLVLDEAVSALDVTVQAQILRLLDELQKERGLSYLFVSHDLAVVARIADTVSVLSRGKVVEAGFVQQVFQNPQHPYTKELINAIPGKRF